MTKEFRRLRGSLRVFFSLCLPVGVLLGCATTVTEKKTEDKVVVREITEKRETRCEGSLWQESGPLGGLFQDYKASRVGDIVTIRIVESASASNKATTKTQRNSTMSAGIENLFNLEQRFPPSEPFLNPFSKVKAGLDSSFDGAGTTTRSGSLSAYLAARVTEVLPNGNLKILGSREVMVNNERQYMALTGIIRQGDISSENIVLSTYVSDAKIEYSGVGVVNDRQRPGWLGRMLDVVWPF